MQRGPSLLPIQKRYLFIDCINAFDHVSRSTTLGVEGCSSSVPQTSAIRASVLCACRISLGRMMVAPTTRFEGTPPITGNSQRPAQRVRDALVRNVAFQDDANVVTCPPRVPACHTHIERDFWTHTGIRIMAQWESRLKPHLLSRVGQLVLCFFWCRRGGSV